MRKVLTLLFAATLLLTIASCKKDEDDDNNSSCPGGSLTCTINGSSFTGSTFQNTLLKGNDPTYGIAAKRFDIRATDSNGKKLIISFNDIRDGVTGDGMRLDDWFASIDSIECYTLPNSDYGCLTVLFTYNNQVGTPTDSYGKLIVTSCDATNKKISGTFYGSVTSFSGVTSATIVNGTFTDLCYDVLE